MARPGDPRTGHAYRQLQAWAKGYFVWLCVYCQTPIPEGMHRTRWGCTLAHDVAVSEAPWLALEQANILGLAHRGCNRTAWAIEHYHGVSAVPSTVRSEEW